MGVFSELDLENQQTELDGHDSKTAEMQTLQAKLIQQHEQKKLPPLRKRRAKSLRRSRLLKRKQSRKILRQRKQKSAVGTRKQKLNGKRNGSGSRRKSVLLNRLRLQKSSR